ncbi:IS6 family transposase (plasmid) [Kitasatospora sp. NBC_00070]
MWLYFRFPLSFREVEELMLQRGVVHLDEVFIKIQGEWKYLWRAVDADSEVLDILVQNRRDKAAARRFFRRLLTTTTAVPRVVVTDKLASYRAAHREVMPSVEHRSHKGLNNRAENSHQPTRQRERAMKGFRTVGSAQRFLAAFSGISPHFRPHRHLMTAGAHRLELTIRFTIWDHITTATSRPAAS